MDDSADVFVASVGNDFARRIRRLEVKKVRWRDGILRTAIFMRGWLQTDYRIREYHTKWVSSIQLRTKWQINISFASAFALTNEKRVIFAGLCRSVRNDAPFRNIVVAIVATWMFIFSIFGIFRIRQQCDWVVKILVNKQHGILVAVSFDISIPLKCDTCRRDGLFYNLFSVPFGNVGNDDERRRKKCVAGIEERPVRYVVAACAGNCSEEGNDSAYIPMRQ